MRAPGEAPAFLTTEKYEEFRKPERFVARAIAEIAPETGRANPATRTDLVAHITSRLRSLGRREGVWFESMCVRVRHGDGMSWSAEAVRAALLELAPQFTLWSLSRRSSPDSLPIIADRVGLRPFLRLAATHKLTRSFVTLRWWLAPVILISVVACGVLVRILEALLKARGDSAPTIASLLGDWTFLALTAVVAAAGLGAQQLTALLTTRTESESLKNFRQDLDAKEQSREYDAFVEALAARLAGEPFPRIVIIDDFEALDWATAKTIRRYFQTHRERARGSEFWIVFEREDGERFTNHLIAGRAADGPSPVSIFEQLAITAEQKAALIRMLNRPARAADFTAVKPICEDDKEGAARWISVFAQYRPPGRPRPARYDDLDFLYLLSLTAEPGEVSLSTDDIVSSFAQKNVERARVLQQILPEADLKPAELRSSVQQIDQYFQRALIFSPDRRQRRVALEAAEALRAMPGGDLPPAGLGHFFWALFWHDRFGPRARQAFWMRKIAYHARAMEFSAMRLSDSDPLQRRALDILLVTADGCLKTGVFAEVTPLLRKAADLLHADGGSTDPQRLRQLLRGCWEAYWVVGDPELIAMASEAYGLLGGAASSAGPSPTALGRLFLETVTIQAGNAAVRAMTHRLSGGVADVSDSVFDYLSARSAWVALTAAPHLVGLGLTELVQATVEALETLDDLGRRAWERLAQESGVPRVTDAMALSLALWAAALRMRWPRAQLLELSEARIDERLLEIYSRPATGPTAMARVLEMSANAVLVAGKMTGKAPTGGEISRETDFPLSAAIHELCAMAAASVVAAAHWSARHGGDELTPEEIKQVADILTEVSQILGASLPAVASNTSLRSTELRVAVDRLLLGCEILWQTFELPQLRDSLAVRRSQFDGMCFEINVQNFATHARDARALRGLEADDLLGVMANLAVADRLRHVTALSTFYIVRAGRITLHGRFGAAFQHEIAFMVVMRARATTLDLAEFIDELLRPAAPGTVTLGAVLGGLHPSAFCGAALRFLEAASATVPPDDRGARVRAALTPALATLPEEVRAEANALLDVNALRDQLRKGAHVTPADVLDAWQTRRELWTYAWTLELLLREGHETPELLAESVAVLSRDPPQDRFNARLYLAMALGEDRQHEHPGAPTRARIAETVLGYLKTAHARWEPDLAPVANLRAFQVLERLDPSNEPTYRISRARWELLKIELDHVQRLPALLDQKRFFDVFLDYWAGMSDWGLPTDPSGLRDLGIERSNIPAEERQRVVRNWLHGGGRVPSPWSSLPGHRAVSLAFVTLGQFVFAAPLADDPDMADVQRMFNEAAYGALPDLFRMVVALPRLPVALKELVGQFQDRFQRHAAPDAAP